MRDLKEIHCGECGRFLFATVVEEGYAGCPKCQVETPIATARAARPTVKTRARRKPGDKTCEVCGAPGATTRNIRYKPVDTCGRSCSMKWSRAYRD